MNSAGSVYHSNAKLDEVIAKYKIDLQNVRVKGKTQSDFGNIVAENSYLQDIFAQYNIDLTKTNGRVVHSNFGSISAITGQFRELSAQYNLVLKNVTAKRVTSAFGSIEWINTTLDRTEADQIESQYNTDLQKVRCRKVKSKFGAVSAKDSILKEVHAQYDISLKNTYAEECESKFGNITIVCHPRQVFKMLFAHYSIDVENVEVKGKVVAKFGQVRAKNSELKEVECQSKLVLVNSRTLSVQISSSIDRKAVIDLTKSTIDGNVIVKDNTIVSAEIIETVVEIRDLFFGIFNFNFSKTENQGQKFDPTINLEIKGNGVVNGDVIFQGCKGKVVVQDQLRGEVRMG